MQKYSKHYDFNSPAGCRSRVNTVECRKQTRFRRLTELQKRSYVEIPQRKSWLVRIGESISRGDCAGDFAHSMGRSQMMLLAARQSTTPDLVETICKKSFRACVQVLDRDMEGSPPSQK